MAQEDVRISDLPPLDVADIKDTTLLTVVDLALNYKITVGDLRTLINNGIDARPRFFGVKAENIIVPDVYGADAITLLTPPLTAGRYLLSYAIQFNFDTQKDKEIAYILTGDEAGDELAQSQSIASTVGKRSTNYSYYVDLPAEPFETGLMFRDVNGGNNFVVDFVDIMLLWVSETPAP